jgi:hypothetical protein
MNEFEDGLDMSAGDLFEPTMRGSANLDAEDYERFPVDPDSLFLEGEIQEETPSRPGSGAGPAPDIDGMSQFDLLNETEDDPGMSVSDYGSSPWGPGSGIGYRPASLMQTDLAGAGLGTDEVAMRTADAAVATRMPRMQQSNRMPSNAGIDPATLPDRSSFEYDDDPQNVIGTGIFDDETGTTWNAQQGIFANQFALPAYIAQEGMLDTQQSQMWDSVANNWRVVQPSGGGVSFATNVPYLKPTSNPSADQQFPSMRPERTGPRSHIEAFGREAARVVVDEARTIRDPLARNAFLTRATEALGVGQATRCRQVAERLVSMGYKPDTAIEDVLAHCVMHATMKDMVDRTNGRSGMPRVDRMSAHLRNGTALRQAVTTHIAPIASNPRPDITALTMSPAASGMGQVATAEPSNAGRNLVLGAAALGVGYLLLQHTQTGRAVQRNVKRHARRIARRMGVK